MNIIYLHRVLEMSVPDDEDGGGSKMGVSNVYEASDPDQVLFERLSTPRGTIEDQIP